MFKSYRILKFAILAGSVMKKCGKFEFSDILGKLELVCQSFLNQAEIFTSSSLHHDKKSVLKELWNFKKLATLCRFYTKESLILNVYSNFWQNFGKKLALYRQILKFHNAKRSCKNCELQNVITFEHNWIS